MASLTRSLLARGYATAASSIKPPVQLTSLSGTYATSTYLAALKKSPKELDTLAKNVADLEKKIKDEPKVSSQLNNPTLNEQDKQKIINTLVPSGSSSILTNLLLVLSHNGRLPLISHVLSDFNTLMSAYRNELLVTVTSAEPLSPNGAEMKRLERAIKGSSIAKGKEVKLINKVNPGVLGGLMIDFGDKTIDLTAQSRVTKYSAALSEAV